MPSDLQQSMSFARRRGYDSDHMNPLEHSFAAGMAFRKHVLTDKQVLFAARQKPSRLFFVSQGCVRLVRPLRHGANAVMQRAQAGEWLAESSLFSDRYHCDAIAQGTSEVVSVSKRDLLMALEEDPGRSIAFCELLAKQLRRVRGIHEIVRIRSARERVLQWLLFQASGNPPQLPSDQTWTQIAEEISLTREAVYRAVAELKRSGALKQRGNSWFIDVSK